MNFQDINFRKIDYSDIPDRREEETTPLEQSQAIMLRQLRIFDRISKDYELTYWLDGGTLLGAVRNNGFISWDDKLDVAMLREDYDKFRKYAFRDLPEDCFFQTSATDPDYKEYHGRIRDRYSTYLDEENASYFQGIGMNIFPMDILDPERDTAESQVKKSNSLYILKHSGSLSEEKKLSKIPRVVTFAGKLIPHALIDHVIHKMQKRYRFDDSNHISYGLDSFSRNIFPLSEVFPLKEMNFEGFTFSVPGNTENYLTELFGPDYMTLPPEKERKPHSLEIRPMEGHGHR